MNSGVAIALVAAGVTMLEELAYIPINELLEIKALDASQIELFRLKARQYLLSEVLGGEELPPGPWEDDGEPQPVIPLRPLSPMSGGANAQIEDNEKK